MAAPPPATTRPSLSLDLNGVWRAQPGTTQDKAPDAQAWGTMAVPGQARTQLKPASRDQWKDADLRSPPGLWLEKQVEIPQSWQGHRIVLRSELVEQAATVFIDGKQAGVLSPPGDGVDLSAALAPGKTQTLRLFIARGQELPEGYPTNVVGLVGPLGIAGSLRLDALAPRIAVDDVFVMPSTRKKQLGAQVRLHSKAQEAQLTLRAIITETDDRPVRSTQATVQSVPAGESVQNVAFPWEDPVLWEIDRPHLYKLKVVALDAQGNVLDTWGPDTFGFREFWLDGRHMMLNGHDYRSRLLWHWGVGENNLPFYQGIGFNAVAIQPRDSNWFSGWGDHKEVDALVDSLDRRGMALYAIGRTVNGLDKTFPQVADYYRRATQMRISRYQNHPSIFLWNISLNVGNNHEEWMPPGIGQTPKGERAEHMVVKASSIVAELDPTRSVLAHAAGNIAPVASANVYLNLVPLQEREEWLSEWSRTGQRPFAGIEFGSPYSANFFRKGGPEPTFTENCATFVGDDAYRMEKTAYVEQVEPLTVTNTNGHGSASIYEGAGGKQRLQTMAANNTAFFPVVTEFVRRTNRSWRAFGHNAGSHQWMWNIGLGGTPSGPMNSYFYTDLTGTEEELRRRPEWANPFYDAFRETQQPLLAYIGGRAERFTEHDHAFFPGDEVEKQIIAIWDEGWGTELSANWRVTVGDRQVAGETVRLNLKPGEIRMAPFGFKMPDLTQAADGKIELIVSDPSGKQISTDMLAFQVIPRPAKVSPAGKVLVWDPNGESTPWLREIGLMPTAWQPGQAIGDATSLVIGRNALSGADKLSFGKDDLDRGLSVLVLEQQREALEKFGFRVAESFSRRLFPRVADHPILAGLNGHRIEDWRGTATLLPEQQPLRERPVEPRAYHWGNYGVVASLVMEVPQHGNFTPIIDGEFDMRYSPLIEWRCGKGRVLFSQLDLTGRVGADAAATLLGRNLIAYATDAESDAFRKAIYVGGPIGRKLVGDSLLDANLDGKLDALPEGGLVIIGEGASDQLKANAARLRSFVDAGGWVFSLPKTPAELNSGWIPFEPKTERRRAHRAGVEPIALAPFRGMGPADFHWRDIAEFDVFTPAGQGSDVQVVGDGFFLLKPGANGRGGWLFSQADPAPYSVENAGTVELPSTFPISRNEMNKKRQVPKPWLAYTRQRTDRMYAQIIANLGAGPGDELTKRVLQFVALPQFVTPSSWEMTGPYSDTTFEAVQPPEPGQPAPAAAIEWRPVELLNNVLTPKDFANSAKQVVFYRTTVDADHEASVPIRFNPKFETSVAAWCNGQLVQSFKAQGWGPRWAIENIVGLKKGRNDFLFKVHGDPRMPVVIQQVPDTRLGERGTDLLYRDPQRYGDDPFVWFAW